VLGGVGGRTRSIAARLAAKEEFAGHWEYALDEAFFTYPAHPNWGGAGLLNAAGELIGIGSLQIERETEGKREHLNMVVPIDPLKAILGDLRKFGQVNTPPRPWLGVYTAEIDGRLVIVGVAPRGPAGRADLKTGDIVLSINNEHLSSQIGFYRKIWRLGAAGVDVPLTIYRDGTTLSVTVHSVDRARMMKSPRLH
jgi:S1-C subfamily serine protease